MAELDLIPFRDMVVSLLPEKSHLFDLMSLETPGILLNLLFFCSGETRMNHTDYHTDPIIIYFIKLNK